jgi:hypothetical protein
MPADIYSDIGNRRRVFSELLEKRFGDPKEHPLTREDLLSVRTYNFESKMELSLGSTAGLYDWYTNHYKGKNKIFSMLSELGYAQRFGITEQDCKDAANAAIGLHHGIYDDRETRLSVFNELLEKRFGDPKEHPLTREDLLSLSNSDLTTKIKLSLGSTIGFFHWYRRIHKGKNTFFAILEDMGYAQRFGITEQDCRDAAKHKSTSARELYGDRETRLSVFNELLQKRFGDPKEHPLTREDILSLSVNEDFNSKIALSVGSSGGFFAWYVARKKGKKTLFELLEDLGYAQRFGITEQDCKDAARQRYSLAFQIYGDRETRLSVFGEFLEKHFKSPITGITRNHLLSLSQRQFKSKTELSLGSIAGLYDWYVNHYNGKNKIFLMLSDLGYAQRFGITEQDWETRRQIVLVNPKIVGAEPDKGPIAVPDSIFMVPEGAQTQVQVVLSTQKRAAQRSHEYERSPIPVMDQAIAKAFGGMDIATDASHNQILSCKKGDSIAIKSQYPLDIIYLGGLDKAGFSISYRNIRLKTDDPFINSRLSQYINIVQREKETEISPSLMLAFKNDFEPEKTAVHILGSYARMASKAQTRDELFFSVNEALDWLAFIGEASAKNSEHFKNLDFGKFSDEFMNELGRVERSAMRRLNITDFRGVALGEKLKKHLEASRKTTGKTFSSSIERANVLRK